MENADANGKYSQKVCHRGRAIYQIKKDFFGFECTPQGDEQ